MWTLLADDGVALRTDELGSAQAVVHVVKSAAPRTPGDFLLLTSKDVEKAVAREIILAQQDLPQKEGRRPAPSTGLLLLTETLAQLLPGQVPQAQGDLPEESAPLRVGGDAAEPRPLDADYALKVVRTQVALLNQDLAQGPPARVGALNPDALVQAFGREQALR